MIQHFGHYMALFRPTTLLAAVFLSGTLALAQPKTLPYSQNFDTWLTCSTSATASCTLSDGWQNPTTDDFDWKTDANGTPSSSTGPTGDHTTGSGNYLYTEASSPNFGSKRADLWSPEIDLTTATFPILNFWYHSYGQTMGDLHFDISTNGGLSFTEDFAPPILADDKGAGSPWFNYEVNLCPFAGNVVIVRFRYISGSNFYGDFAIDDVTFAEGATVPLDASLAAILAPVGSGACGNSNSLVTVAVTNIGLQPISNVPVNVDLTGGVTANLSGTVVGPLATCQTDTLYLGPVDLSAGGNININAQVNLPSDGDPTNDQLSSSLFLRNAPPAPNLGLANPSPCAPVSVIVQPTNPPAPNNQYLWYEDPSLTNLLFTGDNFATPVVNDTTTFFVAQQLDVDHVGGRPDNVGSSLSTTIDNRGIQFDALTFFVIDSVDLYPTTASGGAITVELRDPSGSVLQSATATAPSAGKFTMPLGFTVPPGNDYQLIVATATPSLGYNSPGGFPFTTPGVIDVTNGLTSGSNTTIYYYLYNLQLNELGCPSDPTPFTVNAIEPPALELGNDTLICSSYILNALNPDVTSYVWSNGSMLPGQTITQTVEDLSVTVTGIGGCTASDTISIEFPTTPVLNLTDVTVCGKYDASAFQPGSGVTYAWSTGESTPEITIFNTGNYSVDVTNACNQQVSANFNVTVQPGPLFDLGPADTAICNANTITLDPQLPGTPTVLYNWSTGSSSSNITLAASAPGSATDETVPVILNASFTSGCTISDTINVIFKGQPNVNLGPDITSCSPVALGAGVPNATYSWNTGQTTQNITAFTSGTYSVSVTTAPGCSSSGSVNVTIAAPFSVDLGPDTAVCVPIYELSTGLDPTVFTHVWDDLSTDSSLTVTQNGTYTVQVTDAGGCTVVEDVQVVFSTAPNLSLGPDVTLCAANATLNTGFPAAQHTWTNGVDVAASTGPSLTVDSSGTYIVTASFGCAGTASDTIVVNLSTPPVSSLLDPVPACDNVTVSTGLVGATHFWSNGFTTETVTFQESGLYTFVATTPGNCEVYDTVLVIVNPTPTVAISAPDTYLVNEFFPLNPQVQPFGIDFQWDFGPDALPLNTSSGAGQKTVFYPTTGLKTVALTVSNGTCIGTATKEIVIVEAFDTTLSRPGGLGDAVEFVAYPNPNGGTFSIAVGFPQSTAYQLVLRDALGREVWTHSGEAQQSQQIAVQSGLPAGVYTLQLVTTSGNEVKRVVVR